MKSISWFYQVVFVFITFSYSHAQQNMRISDVTNAPANPSSVLEVESTTKGILVPRMTTVQRLSIANPANGLLVYDTDADCFMYYTSVNTLWNYLCDTGLGGSNSWLTLGNSGTQPSTNFLGTIDNQDLVFRTNNTERARILNSGDVGIGTSFPTAKLNVFGGSIHTTNNSWAGNNAFVYSSGGEHPFFMGVRGEGTQASPSYPISGKVLSSFLGRDALDFGTASNYGGASVYMVTTENFSSTNKGTRLIFNTTSNGSNVEMERMTVQNNGAVGIGTSAPLTSALLDVSSSNKGVIFPRVALTSATDLATVPGVSDGIFVYNTNVSGSGQNAVSQGYYYWQANRWNKLQTNAYSGIIFGVHNTNTPNNLTVSSGQWWNTGSFITLPPGKWVVYIYELLSPQNGSGSGWDGSERAIWVRTSLSNSNSSYSGSPQIIGSPLASGSVTTPSNYGMVSGAIYVNNNTGTTNTYYMWANIDRYGGTNCGALNFATTAWGENQFFAIPAE
jgi:hypothetical protein